MNKNRIAFFAFLLLLLTTLTSCLFESDDTALSSWLSDQGLPDNYTVQVLSINDLAPVSAEVFEDSTPFWGEDGLTLGRRANLAHDLVLDFAFEISTLLPDLEKADDSDFVFVLHADESIYKSEYFPKDSLPVKETLNLKLSWILEEGSKESFVDSIGTVSDSAWFNSMKTWKATDSADIELPVSVSKKDSSVTFVVPKALTESLKKVKYACRLQLRMSAPEASHVYRFYGVANQNYSPQFNIKASKKSLVETSPFRALNLHLNLESCSECLVLHGGVYDSLVAEFPSAPIMKALSDFYDDEFPYADGNGFDVRQAVVLAQMTFARDDSEGENEFGLPIQVVSSTFQDKMDTTGQYSVKESYLLNKDVIRKSGHPNMVFNEGDSLTLQVTGGMREFLNKASDGRTFKIMFRLGLSVLQAKDTVYANYRTADGDTSYTFLPFLDYSRYDFAQSMKKPVTLKLWLASKRGDK